jgi:hypothetical protein
MRSISIRILGALALVLTFAACGGDDDGDDGGDGVAIDAPNQTIDAPLVTDAPAVTNALGQTCNAAAPDCPAGNSCVVLTGLGSQTTGYCSPQCMNMNTLCSTGYTGPAGGMPVCAVTEAEGAPPSLCAIVCMMGNNAQCPTGLTCQLAGGTTYICVAPAT